MLAWGFLIRMLINGELTAAEFVLYLGLINGFSAYLESLIRETMQLGPMSVAISYLREFLDMENHWGDDSENKAKLDTDKAITIELCDVSYTYPGNERATLSHINMKIKPGEKLALLGLNGAGKTTLDMNLTGQAPEDIDREKLDWALTMSGFKEKYNSLPDKGDTMLVREVNDNALDYSGGEVQKLLFARALYKNSHLLILDEPTAALDPVSECEVFAGFDKMVGNKTAIYISHRLASCRFCEDILVFDKGTVVQRGSHEELEQQEGLYRELWNAQAQYYA